MSSLSAPSFATLLKRHRRAGDMTQEALAERAGISVAAISALERAVNVSPRRDTIDLLAEALALTSVQRAQLHAAARGRLEPGGLPGVPSLNAASQVSQLPLVGRRQELALLERHLAGEGPPLLLLAGEPGIGKSRLLAEGSLLAREQGWSVLEGSCHRRSGQEPFVPLLGALEGHLRRSTQAHQRTALEGCAWLVRLMPELAERTLAPALSWTLPPEQERRLMFAAVARYLANVTGPRGTLLVLDDIHWAGEDALDLLATLVRLPREVPLRILGAFRSTEVLTKGPLGVLITDLLRERLLDRVQLAPLAPWEAGELLRESLAGKSEIAASQMQQVLQRTGGVPFFLVSYAHGLQGGQPTTEVPWNVAENIRQRVMALPQPAQELLEVAAIVGRNVSRAILVTVGSALEQSQREVVAALDSASQAQLLIEEGRAGYSFAHDLIREAVLADLSAARQAMLHQLVGEALAKLPQRLWERRIAELAWHFLEAGEAGRALPYALLAGDQAEEVYAHHEAMPHYSAAFDLARELGDQRHQAEALEKLGTLFKILTLYSRALVTLESARATYQTIGDVEGHGRTLALMGLTYAFAETPEQGLAWMRPRLQPLCASGLSLSGQAALYITLARLYFISEHYDESLTATEQAVELAQQAHDHRLLGQAKLWRGSALSELERSDEGIQVEEEAIDLLEATGDIVNLSTALNNLGSSYQERGEFTQALHYTERALDIVKRLADLEGLEVMTMNHAEIAFVLGEWHLARLDCERAMTLLKQADLPLLYAARPLLQLGTLSLAEGQEEAASQYLTQALVLAERTESLLHVLWATLLPAEWDLLQGHADVVRGHLEPFLDRSDHLKKGRAWLHHLLGWACVEQGEFERAEALITEAIAQATAHHWPIELIEALPIKARLAMRQERWQEAEQVLEETLALCRAMHTPYEEAKALYVYGLLHLQQGETRQARERLNSALLICEQLGERLYARHIEQELDNVDDQEDHPPS